MGYPTVENTVVAYPGSGRALLVGLAPAIVTAAGLIVGLVWFNGPAPDASAETGTAEPGTAATTTPSPATTTTAGDAAMTAEITATMRRYVDGYNAGDAAVFLSSMCESRRAVAPALPDGVPLETQRPQLDGVSDVRVSGDRATAVVTASEEGAPELGSKDTRLAFANEDGWKLC